MSDLQDAIARTAVKALNEGYSRGVLSERERIIELLEPYAKHGELCEGGCYPEDCQAPQVQYLIRLIKGDQK